MDLKKRRDNERKFGQWIESDDGNRIYKMKLEGKFGWHAIYEKVVDKNENTLKFTQFIYDEQGVLRERHEKFPIDKGHKKI